MLVFGEVDGSLTAGWLCDFARWSSNVLGFVVFGVGNLGYMNGETERKGAEWSMRIGADRKGWTAYLQPSPGQRHP